MYCTEISAWFVNQLRPGTIKTSTAMGGYPVFQVADHMRATDVNGTVQPTTAELSRKKTFLEDNAQFPRKIKIS